MKPDHPCLFRIIEEELIDYRIRSRFYHPDYVKRLGLSGAERILEFGSGGGCMSRHLAKTLSPEGALSCVEISPYWMEKARRRLKDYPDIEYLQGDITRMPVPKKNSMRSLSTLSFTISNRQPGSGW